MINGKLVEEIKEIENNYFLLKKDQNKATNLEKGLKSRKKL